MTRKKLKEAIQEFEDWMKKNPNATEEEIEKQRKKCEDKISPILNKAQSRRAVDNYIGDIRRRVEDPNDNLSKISPDEKKKILDSVKELEEWMKKNPDATSEEIDKKFQEILKKNAPITNKSNKRREVEDYTNKIRNKALDNDKLTDYLTDEEKKKILESSQEFLNWLEANPDATEKEIEQKKRKNY